MKLFKIKCDFNFFIRCLCYDVRPFNRIPSPKSFPIIGHSYLFFKNGPFNKEKLTEAAYNLSLKYGPIFFLKFPGKEFIITTDAENAYKLFQYEGRFPYRVSLPALSHYQKKTYGVIGIVSGNGAEWGKLRKSLVPLLTKSHLPNFLNKTNKITETFIGYIKKKRNEDNILFGIHSHLYKYAIECISVVCVGNQLHCLEDENNAKFENIIEGTCNFMDGLYKTYSEPPLWNFIGTSGYKKMENGYNVIKNFIDQKLYEQDCTRIDSLMVNLFQNTTLSQNEIRILLTEVFLSGIDAVATTIAMTLYYLSKDKHRQKIASKNVSDNSKSYIRACIKETLRLSPTAGGTTRSLPVDVVMNNYSIPANTPITIFHSVTSQMEKYFVDAHLYKPERWLHDGNFLKKDEYCPFASLPFGNGIRMCPGRWLAEQECVLLVTEILKEFCLECCTTSNVEMVYRMNRIPDRSIDVKFVDKK